MPKLILTRGLPGSGKSTWAKELVAANPDVVRVNRDNLRFEHYGKYVISKKQEREITKIQQSRVREALSSGRDVVVDDTNLSPMSIGGWHRLAQDYDGKVQLSFRDFNVSPEECIRRDERRRAAGERGTGAEVIARFAANAVGEDGKLKPVPDYIREPIPVPPPVKERPNAVIYDMDGTLCDVRPVRHHVRGDKKSRNFHAFHVESEFCPPNINVLEMAKQTKEEGLSVVIVTAREERYRALTARWLEKHGVEYDTLITRPYGDHRPDYETKKDILAQVSKYYRVVHAVDDNPNVLALWKENGIAVTEVPGFDDPIEDPFGMNLPPIPIDSPIKAGRCLKCNKRMRKTAGVLGPTCIKKMD